MRPKEEFKLKLTIAAIVLLLLVTPLSGYVNSIRSEIDEKVQVKDVEDIIWAQRFDIEHQTYIASIDVLSNSATSGLSLQQLRDRIEAKCDFAIRTEINPRYADLNGWSVKAVDFYIRLDIAVVYDADGRAVPGYYRVYINYFAETKKADNDELHSSNNIEFELSIPDPYPFLDHSKRVFDFDAGTTGGRIRQMVSYMLTSLVRHRLKLEYGAGPYESQLNVLNEGDVELAVNLAVLFEELTVLKQFDLDAAEAVDKFYISARNPDEHKDNPGWTPSNPTGERYWGTAEMENFDKLNSHILGSGIKRSVLQLLNSAMESKGTADTADLFALYLILDREITDVTIDPGDEKSFLDELHLWDPRKVSDNTDVSNLMYSLNFSEPYSFDLFKEHNADDSMTRELFLVDQSPDYLVAGRDIFVNGLIDPVGWYTDIELRNTRTWGVIPSVPPPAQHDYRVQWDLQINGEFDLSIGSLWNRLTDSVYSGYENTPSFFTHDIWLNDTIVLDFPVTIYGWVTTLPQNNGISFTNINPVFWDGGNDTWVQTPAAQSIEYFSNRLWPDIKPMVSTMMDRISDEYDIVRTNYGSTLGLVENSIEFDAIDNKFQSRIDRVLGQTPSEFWDNLDLFSEFYLWNFTANKQYWNTSGGKLWLLEDGFNISISYSDDFQDVTFTIYHAGGKLELIFKGIESGSMSEQLGIVSEVGYQLHDPAVQYLNYSYTKFKDGSWTEPRFTVKMDGGIDFNKDYDPFAKDIIFKTGKGIVSMPEQMVEIELPKYNSNDPALQLQDRRITFRTGFYYGSLSDDSIDSKADLLAQELDHALLKIPFRDTVLLDNSIDDALLAGYLKTIINTADNILEFNRVPDIMFAINMSYRTEAGLNEYREIGFHVSGDNINGLLNWLDINIVEIIDLMVSLPGTIYEISRLITILPFAEMVDVYFIFGRDRFSVVNSDMGTLSSGLSSGYASEPLTLHYPIIIRTIDALPEYQTGRTIGDIKIIMPLNIPEPITLFSLQFP